MIMPFMKEHAYEILSRNLEEEDITVGEFEEYVKTWHDGGPAYTIFFDGKPAFCTGVVLLDWNRGEVWLLTSSVFYSHIKSSFKIMKKLLTDTIKERGLKRVQALVDPKTKGGVSLVEHLGFQREGILRAYGPRSEDLIMFGRIT